MVHRLGILMSLPVIYLGLTAFSPSPFQTSAGFPWWGWPLIAIVLLIVVLLCWWPWGRGKEEAPATPVAIEPSASPAPDDLKRIEGIGPKISGLLRDAGITTFARLADTNVSQLEEILKQAEITIADPATWPRQAALAAAGKWEELEHLQDELKGGREV